MADLSAFQNRPVPDWYAEPQFGIFIHWGIFSVPAFAPAGASITSLFETDYDRAFILGPYAEWYQNALRDPTSPTAVRHKKLYGDAPYDSFRKPFDEASQNFDANVWADLFQAAGARYVVFVTKHHDGYCLWPTAVENPNKPGWHSERDFVGELAEAVRARGMRFGVYYSGGLDWTFRDSLIGNMGSMFAAVPTSDEYRAYALAQAKELIDRYKPSVLWNDIAWPSAQDLPELFAYYYDAVPDGVVNDRWLGVTPLFEGLREPAACAAFNDRIKDSIQKNGVHFNGGSAPPHCDFRTVEYGSGAHLKGVKWESTRGLGLAFAYNTDEPTDNYMTGPQIAELFDEVKADGGNLLLNVGPRADGSIPEVQSQALLDFAKLSAA